MIYESDEVAFVLQQSDQVIQDALWSRDAPLVLDLSRELASFILIWFTADTAVQI